MDASFALSAPATLEATARGRMPWIGVAAAIIVLAGFTIFSSPLVRLALLAAVGVIVIGAFLSTREEIVVSADSVYYRRRGLFGGVAVSSPRSHILGIRVGLGAGNDMRTFTVSAILQGSGLPAGFPLFESIDGAKSEAVARQVAQHLSLPLVGVSSQGEGAA